MVHLADNSMSKRVFILVSLLLITLTVVLTIAQTRQPQNLKSSAASELTNCTVSDQKIQIDQKEKQLFDLINNYRKSKGLSEVQFQESLNQAAAWQSKDMGDHKKFDHTDSANRTPPQRLINCGYTPIKAAGENIALYTANNPQEVFDGWKNSQIHEQNLVCANCTQIGIAEDRGSDDKYYWTMDIGALKDTGSSNTTATGTPTPTSQSNHTGSGKNSSPSATLLPDEPTLPPAPQSLPDGTTGIFITIHIPSIESMPKHPNRFVVLGLDSGKKETSMVIDTSVSFNESTKLFTGVVALPPEIPSGTYRVILNMGESLMKSFTFDIEKGKTRDLPKITMSAINFNSDKEISIADFFLFRDCVFARNCDTRMDVNDDGIINILDYNAIIKTFSTIEGD